MVYPDLNLVMNSIRILNDKEISLNFRLIYNKKKNLFTSKLDLNLRKRLVRCYVWSIALFGAETWTLRATDQKQLESF